MPTHSRFRTMLSALLLVCGCAQAAPLEGILREADPELARLGQALTARVTPSSAERAWLAQRRKVHIHVGQYAPFHFMGGSSPMGLSVDYLRLFCAAWQLDCEYVVGMSAAEALASTMAAEGIDLLPALQSTPERRTRLQFSRAYNESPNLLVVRNGGPVAALADLAGRRLVIDRNHPDGDILRAALPQTEIFAVDSGAQALSRVALGEADAYIGARPVVDFLIERIGYNILRVAGPVPFPPNIVAVATRRDWPELASLIDKTLAATSAEEHQQLLEPWTPVDRDSIVRRETALRWAGILIVLTLFATSALWIVRLRREVGARRQTQLTLEEERATLEERVATRTAELRVAKETAEQASQAKSLFLAIMSHELRTPLSGMLGLTRLLARTPLSDEQRKILDGIEKGGSAQLAQLSDILDLSRIEAGHLDIRPAPTDLRALVHNATVLFGSRAEEKGLLLDSTVDAQLPPWLLLDGRRLTQVMHNLIDNAIRFTNIGGIAVRVLAVRDRLTLEVSDTGTGIPAEAQARIFEPFVQANGGLDRKHAGSGLGLAICRHLLEAMGGGIDCDSQPGSGSTFRVDLPLLQAEAPATAGGAEPLQALPSLFILLVDDDPLNRMATAGLLEAAGHLVLTCADAADALETFDHHPINLVLADLHMPKMDGIAFARALLAQHPRAQEIVRIALTADITPDTQARCQGLYHAVLNKPLDEAELAAHLHQLLPSGDAAASCAPAAPIDPSPAGATLVDGEHLHRVLASLGPERSEEWLAQARQLLREGVAALQQLAAADARDTLIATAHRLVSSAAIAGLIDLREAARRLETAARAGTVLAPYLADVVGQLDPGLAAFDRCAAVNPGVPPEPAATAPSAFAAIPHDFLLQSLDCLSEGLLLIDGQQRVAGHNAAFLRAFDLPATARFIGRPYAELLGELHRRGEFGAASLETVLHARQDAYRRRETLEFTRVRPNGRALSVSARPTLEDGYIHTYIDVTDSHLARDAIRRQHKAAVVAMANLAESRDTTTGTHVLRVARTTEQIVRRLRQSGRFADIIDHRFAEHLPTASILHDVGKIAIPDQILLKPGPLTDAERDIMQTHAADGARLLEQAGRFSVGGDYLRYGEEIARTHHEHFDGQGYPRGLAGADIPLSGRIVAIADVFDAITSRRPYKKPWDHAEAMSYIAERAGKQFDPVAVEAFVVSTEDLMAHRLFVWEASMSVGDDEIDEQHQMLIDVINRLAHADHRHDRLAIETAIDELVAYVGFHFDHEEKLMTTVGYPALAGHCANHRDFAAQVMGFRDDFHRQTRPNLGGDILTLLRDWLVRHILTEDQGYKRYLV